MACPRRSAPRRDVGDHRRRSRGAFLDDCPVVRVAGRSFPIDISYAPATSVSDAVVDLLRATPGDVLCFLPGALEIQKTIAELRRDCRRRGGAAAPRTLDAAEQDRALRGRRGCAARIVVATNIAETSVTVPGVTAVVDAGLQKVARYDAARAIDSLATERITARRRGSARRSSRTRRRQASYVGLWDPRDRLRPHREPDIHRIDLSSTVLDILGWGGNPRSFEWFEAPRPDAIDRRLRLLERLERVDDGESDRPRPAMQSMPLHPRLARILIAGSGSRLMCESVRHPCPSDCFCPLARGHDLRSAVGDRRLGDAAASRSSRRARN